MPVAVSACLTKAVLRIASPLVWSSAIGPVTPLISVPQSASMILAGSVEPAFCMAASAKK